MNKLYLYSALAFVAGAGIGVASTYGYFKKKFQKIADEEIESVREVYRESRKEENDISWPKAEIPTYEPDNTSIINELRYASEEHPEDELEGPRRIMRNEFVENKKYYDQETLTYYVDEGIMVDELTQEPFEDFDDIGVDILEAFENSSEDEMYVRNDRLSKDYEVLKSFMNSGFIKEDY